MFFRRNLFFLQSRVSWKILFFVGLISLPSISSAVVKGIGDIANNMMEPVVMISNFIGTIAIVIGISFLFASFLKYMQHRVNPLYVPISTVILLFIMGLILIGLPFIYMLTQGGIPLSF